MTNKISLNTQLTFDDARKPEGRGGWRPNSGRKKGRTTVSHDERPDFPARIPQLVTWRLADDMPSVCRPDLMTIIRDCIAASHKPTFRICQYDIEGNHMHFGSEAQGKSGLARGLQGLSRRLTPRLNAALGRTGKIFASRYHSRSLATPREVRNALAYVLLNSRHHAADRGAQPELHWLSPYSSGAWFDGWARQDYVEFHTPSVLRGITNPTAPPQTWLLSVGWRQWGLLEFDEVPGTKRRSSKSRGK